MSTDLIEHRRTEAAAAMERHRTAWTDAGAARKDRRVRPEDPVLGAVRRALDAAVAADLRAPKDNPEERARIRAQLVIAQNDFRAARAALTTTITTTTNEGQN